MRKTVQPWDYKDRHLRLPTTLIRGLNSSRACCSLQDLNPSMIICDHVHSQLYSWSLNQSLQKQRPTCLIYIPAFRQPQEHFNDGKTKVRLCPLRQETSGYSGRATPRQTFQSIQNGIQGCRLSSNPQISMLKAYSSVSRVCSSIFCARKQLARAFEFVNIGLELSLGRLAVHHVHLQPVVFRCSERPFTLGYLSLPRYTRVKEEARNYICPATKG